MSFERKIFHHFNQDEPSGVYRDTSGTERGGCAFPQHRLVILTLGLLDVLLLIAAVVIGIYCAKAKDFQVSDVDATPLLVELRYLQNYTNMGKFQKDVKAALAQEYAAHLELKNQIREKTVITDILQRKIEVLLKEKNMLKSNMSALEENCDRCPSGWNLLKSSCYYYSKYEPGLRKNWNDSRAECVKEGGDLVVIDSLLEQQLLKENLPKLISVGTWWENGFWIGLTNVRGTWTWINNTAEPDALYWREGEPKQSGLRNGSCAALFNYLQPMNAWYNANCKDNQLNWICEMKPRDA